MQRQKRADIVIAGGGWVGLAMAKEIATRTSLSVVVLERGPARKLADYAKGMDELDYFIRYRMMQNLADETVTHRHSIGAAAVPIRQYGSFNPGTGVGGAGEHWTGLSYRYFPDVFRLATVLREKHGASKLPQDLAVQDWGVTYEEIEPLYWRAEQMMGIGGKAGNLQGQRIEGGNIFEGPRSHEYPNPPHPPTYLAARFQKAALELGYHPYPTPAATLSRTYRNPDGISRSGCAYCGYCMRHGCMIGAKAQPTNTLLPVLVKRNNFTLRPGCWVRRVVHREGKAEGVTYLDSAGNEVLQPADVVILSSWTLNNARLLLLSGIGEPYNPATGKGTLGKNLTHQVGIGTQVFLDRHLNSFMGAGGLGVTVSDLDGDRGSDPASGVLRGGSTRINSTGEGPISSFGRIPPGEVQRNWGSDWKKAALQWHDKVATITCEAEHLAYRQNFVDLDPAYTDKFGDPLLRLTLDWTDHERRQSAVAAKVQQSIGKAMGGRIGGTVRGVGAHYSVTDYQSTHIQGGAIMGTSPGDSVVNPWFQHWRVPNLWVAGGSAFPQNASGNPTLTILAMAYRAADALIGRYLKRPGALA
ncbi:MAG TPA: GMC family oxidoreductase [Candidatus Acidoferrales bacterium]|jgi:gluconate 2-dehydrogenase alpha chain|nr:GMC family oxidoreductase [Candidatus Acidoferrales bacterium]